MEREFFISFTFIFIIVIIILICWIIKLKDETKKKNYVQEKLELSEEKHRVLFDIAPVLLDAFDENGKVILWNKECEKVFGWTLNELQEHKKPISLFYDDENIQNQVLEDLTKESKEYKVWFPKRKDGKNLVVKWANIRLPNGELIHMGYDITEQKENEKLLEQNTLTLEFAKNELEILNNSLEKRIKSEIEKSTKQQALIMEQSKLVQMGEMIQNIAHQWRQPLSQINSTLMLLDVYLNKKNCMNDVVEEKISEIEELTSYLSHTIDDFQNFFKPNKHKTLFKISDALHKSLNIVKGQIDFHKIEIVDNINKDLEINGQKEELQQVLLVLINNAIDALVLNKISNPKIVFGNILENNILTIIVEDNALGIKEENLKRIFEPYFTTKYKSKGTGVGLYIAKMILQNSLYGDLSVENINDGARFKIKLEGVL